MNRTEFLQLLKNKKTVQYETEWNTLSNEFPFCGSFQYKKSASKKQHSRKDSSNLSLFQGNEYLHYIFLQSIYKEEEIIIPEIIVEENKPLEKTDLKKSEDILDMINELPNFNPIPKKAPSESNLNIKQTESSNENQKLMVMMSFNDWLNHLKSQTEKNKQEEIAKKALKTSWQKEKLAALSEEENEEIPEQIFKQAMDSISETSMVSESFAKILAQQGKIDKALDMYKKLSLQNPSKSSYFASLILKLKNNNEF